MADHAVQDHARDAEKSSHATQSAATDVYKTGFDLFRRGMESSIESQKQVLEVASHLNAETVDLWRTMFGNFPGAELRKLNIELEQALRRSDKLALTGQLVATIAHEINNPLESLMNLLHLLRANPTLDDSGREMVELAQLEVGRLGNISSQTLAPLREAEFPVVTKVSELLDDALTMFRRKLESAQIEVRSEYQTEGEVTIYPGELRQVFANLITNAVDAMGKRGELSLSIERLPYHEVAVRVTDTGCGIPSENLSTIFDPFFTTKGEKGTGIGLWVTKSIVDKVGGRIEVVSSTTGKTGTCFSIFLPTTNAGTREQAGDTEVNRKREQA
jgi:signal transduction histidine kinase